MQEGISYLVQQVAAGLLTRAPTSSAGYDDNDNDWWRGGGEGGERLVVTQ